MIHIPLKTNLNHEDFKIVDFESGNSMEPGINTALGGKSGQTEHLIRR